MSTDPPAAASGPPQSSKKIQGPYSETDIYVAVTRRWCRLPSKQQGRERPIRMYFFFDHRFVASIERSPVDLHNLIEVILRIVTARAPADLEQTVSLPLLTTNNGPFRAVTAWWHPVPVKVEQPDEPKPPEPPTPPETRGPAAGEEGRAAVGPRRRWLSGLWRRRGRADAHETEAVHAGRPEHAAGEVETVQADADAVSEQPTEQHPAEGLGVHYVELSDGALALLTVARRDDQPDAGAPQ